MGSLPAEQPGGCPAVLGLWKADGGWRERSDGGYRTGEPQLGPCAHGPMSLGQAQGISHELMTLGLIVLHVHRCPREGRSPKAHPSRAVTELPAQPERSRCPRAVPMADGDKWDLGRQSSTAKLCPVSQDQHSPWTGTPQGHQLGWLCQGRHLTLGRSWGYLGQSVTTLTAGPSPFSPLIPGPCPSLPHLPLSSYSGLHS